MAFLNTFKLMADDTAASVAVQRTGLFVASLKDDILCKQVEFVFR